MTISVATLCLAFLFGHHFGLSSANDGDSTTEKIDPNGNAIPSAGDISREFIYAFDGTSYNINSETLKPYNGLFSSEYYVHHGKTVTDTRTNQTLDVTVYRASYEDGTFIQASKGPDGEMDFFEIRRRGFPTTQISYKDFRTYITLASIDEDAFNKEYHYGDSILAPDDKHRLLRGATNAERRKLQHTYTRNDGTAEECRIMKVVKLAITYDAFFCELYGSKAAAISKIESIVSGASEYFENDMCLRLELTGIHTPDDCTNTAQSRYKNMAMDNPCDWSGGKASFLSDYAQDMSTNRNSFEIDSKAKVKFDEDSIIHHFTGRPPTTGTLGCSFIGAACSSRWGYGVNYMATKDGKPQALDVQEVLLAHEFGHTIGMRHFIAEDGKLYIMNPFIRTDNPSFHATSIETALNHLEDSNCGYDEIGTQNNQAPPLLIMPTSHPPTKAPSKRPTPAPTNPPSRSPTKAPSNRPTPAPTNSPSRPPTKVPSKSPTPAPTPRPSASPPQPTTTPDGGGQSTHTVLIVASRPTRSPPTTPLPSKRPTPTPTDSPPTTRQQPTHNILQTAPMPSRSPPPTSPPSKQPTFSPTAPPSVAPVSSTTENAGCDIVESGAISQAQCAQMSDKGKFACYEKSSLLQAHVASPCNGDSVEIQLVSWTDELQPRFLAENHHVRGLKKDKGDKQAKQNNKEGEESGTSTNTVENKNGKENVVVTNENKSGSAKVVKLKKVETDKCSNFPVIEIDTLLCFSAKVANTNHARVYTVDYNVKVRQTVTKLSAQVSILPEGAQEYDNCGKSETSCKNK